MHSLDAALREPPRIGMTNPLGFDRQTGDGANSLSTALVAVAQRRDRQAFARLFVHFGPRIKTYMMQLGTPYSRAEDLAQETMIMVWRKAALFDPSKAGAATWIFTVARNLRIDQARRERHPEVSDDVLLEMPDERPLADSAVARAAEDERIRIAMAALPPDQAEVIRLSFFADLAHSAIAQRLNLPLGTVKSRLRLAMLKIRNELKDEDRS
jgi:RNA polymerase sigma-70 factor (ECF subfamily)